MSSIELLGLTKSFGKVKAVTDFSLEIERGEMIALVGPSGCGKTTLLRMIAGFELPDNGDIRFWGKSVLGEEPERRRVGIVFQDYALFPHMSVSQNVGYGLKFLPRPERTGRERRVEELLEMVGLAGYGNRGPHELSAGQQQRVALARALAPRPAILLLDEPMSALDALLREELRVEVRRLQRRLGITTIHVTHDQEEAIAIADRVAVMLNGSLEQVDPPQEIYFRPRTDFVASFIGRGNLLSCTVAEVGQDAVRVRIGENHTAEVPHGEVAVCPGENIHLLVRPDRIVCGDGRRNRIRGEVAGVEFLGEVSRLRLRTAAGDILVVIDSSDAASWEQKYGKMTEVSFNPDDAWVVRSSQTG